MKPKVLYVDTAYTVKIIRERELEQFWLSRECGGFFEHVWTCHLLADLPLRRKPRNRGFHLDREEFSERLTALEGESTYYAALERLRAVNVIFSQLRAIAHLADLVNREKISIVVVTDPYFAGLVGLALKALTGVPVAVWVIANYDEAYAANKALAMPGLFPRHWIQKAVERFVFKRVDLTAGGNQNNLEFALKNGARESRATVFPVGKNVNRVHAVAPEHRQPDPWFRGRENVRHFICIGRLNEVKLPEDAIKAFSVLHATRPDTALIMAGDGPMRAELEELARELGIAGHVHFLGFVNQARLAGLVAGCFAVLSPLTGGALVEAALGGVPLLVYDRDWQAAFVGPSGAGVVLGFRDWQAMGRAAIELLDDPDEARRMGDAARRLGVETCDLEKAYAHEQAEFSKLIERARTRVGILGRITRARRA